MTSDARISSAIRAFVAEAKAFGGALVFGAQPRHVVKACEVEPALRRQRRIENDRLSVGNQLPNVGGSLIHNPIANLLNRVNNPKVNVVGMGGNDGQLRR